eukprot:g3933.t1
MWQELHEETAFCPAVMQHVEVLDDGRTPRLLEILRAVQEAEKKGSVQRSLTLVFCSEASVAPVALALGQRQMACIKLTAPNQKETESASLEVSYDLPDLEAHRKRLERLNEICFEESFSVGEIHLQHVDPH